LFWNVRYKQNKSLKRSICTNSAQQPSQTDLLWSTDKFCNYCSKNKSRVSNLGFALSSDALEHPRGTPTLNVLMICYIIFNDNVMKCPYNVVVVFLLDGTRAKKGWEPLNFSIKNCKHSILKEESIFIIFGTLIPGLSSCWKLERKKWESTSWRWKILCFWWEKNYIMKRYWSFTLLLIIANSYLFNH
jgi:hypothetical protein